MQEVDYQCRTERWKRDLREKGEASGGQVHCGEARSQSWVNTGRRCSRINLRGDKKGKIREEQRTHVIITNCRKRPLKNQEIFQFVDARNSNMEDCGVIKRFPRKKYVMPIRLHGNPYKAGKGWRVKGNVQGFGLPVSREARGSDGLASLRVLLCQAATRADRPTLRELLRLRNHDRPFPVCPHNLNHISIGEMCASLVLYFASAFYSGISFILFEGD